MTTPYPAATSFMPAAGLHPSEQLKRHFDGLRDSTVPQLRFDVAGLPFPQWRDTLRPRLRSVLGLQAVRHGYACLALEMRGFGELRLPEDLARDAPKSCPRLVSLAEQVGRTLIGMRVHDVMAAADYLARRPEVDSGRLVLTGNSGGGAVTLFATALDTRIAASVPSCWFGTYAGSMQLVNHCPCNFVPGLSLLCDVSDLAGLAAPRPQLIVNGSHDANHPLKAAEDAWPLTQQIYAAAGAPDAVQWFVGEGGHRYYAAPVWPWLAGALNLPPQFANARYEASPPPASDLL